MDQNNGIRSMILCALEKFASEVELADVSVAIVGVSARPITITTKAAMMVPPVTALLPPFPFIDIWIKRCICEGQYIIILNLWDDYSNEAIVLYISHSIRIG